VEQKISVGSFAMTASLVLLVINDALGLSRRFVEFFEYVGNVNDGVGAIIRDQEVLDVDGAKDLKITRGDVRFDNVSFSYTQENPVFENLNVHIKAGERVGLVGFSGSGKTTFTNLILRLYDLKSGTISIDEQDVAKVTQDSLRAQISMIPQDPVLFHRSLLENIRYGRIDATDEEVFAAAQAAHAHQFITQRKEGYEALVGERGIKLSGGQRQRIAIARAILKNAPILILDEATSSLDSITEKSIQASLETLMKDRTVIVIAHRLSTIAHLNRILVFDKGRVVESGPHAELLSKNGHYARLWNMQVGGFLPAGETPEVAEL
jgi:ATP-binding cassette subfamily B protein